MQGCNAEIPPTIIEERFSNAHPTNYHHCSSCIFACAHVGTGSITWDICQKSRSQSGLQFSRVECSFARDTEQPNQPLLVGPHKSNYCRSSTSQCDSCPTWCDSRCDCHMEICVKRLL